MKEKIEVIEEVKKLIISFSEQNLTEEEEEICLNIWKKLTHKQKLDITRTRPNIWAAAIIWSFCRANFKYEEGITLEVLCNFFSNKKSTVGNKAGEIVKMLKIDYFSPKFSTRKIQEQNPLNILTLASSDGSQILKEVSSKGKEPGSKRRQAEETLDEGLDLLYIGNEEEAGRYFFKSIEIDPTYADGYNHMANIAWRKGDWKQAEGLYRKAIDFAEPEVKDIPKGNFWGVLESRPYMRSLHGLGLTAWKQGRLEEAKDIFEKMLKLNSNDNQGARYIIGPIYHQMGNLDKAIKWYVRNLDDPDNLYNYVLALIQQNELEVAARMLVSAIFENPYVAPMLLKDKLPESDWWHGSNLAEPQYAEDYMSEYHSWWEKEESALRLLRAIWDHGEVQRILKDYIAIRRAMNKARNGEERVSLGRASDRLIRPEKIMRLARKIYEEFIKGKTGQIEFL
jgi:tetratricopeptide (TPR) repeat protein